MKASTDRRYTAALVLAAAAGLLAAACTDHQAASTLGASSPATTAIHATATPRSAPSGPAAGGDLAWLEAVGRLHHKIDEVLVRAPSAMTPRNLRATADKLRGCTRELDRLGSPTGRFHPVYALARKGCAQYDKAAACFVRAARIGAPVAGTAEERRFNAAIDCGFSAPGRGSKFLSDAEIKGDEIKESG